MNFTVALKQGESGRMLTLRVMRASIYAIARSTSILALLAVGSAEAEIVRVGGTGTATALMQSLGAAYAEGRG